MSITPKKSDSPCVQQQLNIEFLKVLEQWVSYFKEWISHFKDQISYVKPYAKDILAANEMSFKLS